MWRRRRQLRAADRQPGLARAVVAACNELAEPADVAVEDVGVAHADRYLGGVGADGAAADDDHGRRLDSREPPTASG